MTTFSSLFVLSFSHKKRHLLWYVLPSDPQTGRKFLAHAHEAGNADATHKFAAANRNIPGKIKKTLITITYLLFANVMIYEARDPHQIVLIVT